MRMPLSSVRPLRSLTVPATRTTWPSATSSPKPSSLIKMPSEVWRSASWSSSSSWTKNPESSVRGSWKSPTTTASTVWMLPTSGLASPSPWMTWT